MLDVSEILDRANVPRENQLMLIRELWDIIKTTNPDIDRNYVLIIWPSQNNLLEVDILPRPILNPLPNKRLPDRKANPK